MLITNHPHLIQLLKKLLCLRVACLYQVLEFALTLNDLAEVVLGLRLILRQATCVPVTNAFPSI